MGRKKSEGDAVPDLDSLALLRAGIEAKWGKGVMVSAAAIMDEQQQVIPVGPQLDIALSGGIPEGSWVSISGPPKSGKTTSLLSFAANAQRPEYGNRVVHYFNIEGRIRSKNIGGILGLNQHPDRFVIYESDENHILTGKDFLEMAIMVLKTDKNAVLILDSVSCLVDSAVMEGGLGTQTRGGGAKLVSQFIDIVASVVPVRKHIVLGVTHIISDVSGNSRSGQREKTSNRWLYQADIRLKAYAERWEVGEKEIGKKVHWTCQESALGPPGMKCLSYLRYGVGIDRLYETFEMAKVAQVLQTSGNWHIFSFLDGVEKDVPKVNGAEKAYVLLLANPAWAELLRAKTNAALGGTEATP